MNKTFPIELVMRSKIDQYFVQQDLRLMAATFMEYKLRGSTIFSDLVRLHYRMFGGTSHDIEQAAAAIECMLLALDIYDDLQDKDNDVVPWSEVDPALAMNVAVGLQSLSMAMLEDAGFSNSTKNRAVRYINQAILRAVNGQHTDLLNFINEEEDCLHMLRNKSGALVACACLVGATLVTDEYSELIAQYGQSIGVIGQIRNDMQGIQEWDVRNDLLYRKRTLPILYLLDFDHPQLHIVRSYYAGQATRDELLNHKLNIHDLIQSSGSLQYAEVILKTLQYEVKELVNRLPVEDHWKEQLEKFYL